MCSDRTFGTPTAVDTAAPASGRKPMPRLHLSPRAVLSPGAALGAIASIGIAVGPAAAQQLGPLTRITGPSPFAGCTADRVGEQEGINYPNTEIEPWVAADPRRPNRLLTGWQQDRWSNGGSRGLLAGASSNGGASWTTRVPGKVTKCEDGPFTRASDPWVDFTPNGIAYFMHLAFEPDQPDGGFGDNAMLVTRSTDGGLSWGGPITLRSDTDPQVLNDKNSLRADPTNANFAYAVWDRLIDFTLPPGAAEAAAAGAGDGVVRARERVRQLRAAASGTGERQPTELFFTGPVWFARTINGGLGWQPARQIFATGPNSQTINNLIEVTPGGTVIDFHTRIFANGGTRIGLLRSFDRGATFRGPTYAATITTVNGVVTPDAQELVRDASILFDSAVDPANGNLYLVWQDVRFTGQDAIAFTMSTNGGVSWSAPVRINKTPRNPNPLRQQAFVPSIEVGPRGQLVVTYYDFRNDRDNGREATDFWAVFCDSRATNCRQPASWGLERRLTNQSFDMLDAPIARGHFLGDYMGLTRAGNAVIPVFGIATAPDRTALFTRRINFGAASAEVASALVE